MDSDLKEFTNNINSLVNKKLKKEILALYWKGELNLIGLVCLGALSVIDESHEDFEALDFICNFSKNN